MYRIDRHDVMTDVPVDAPARGDVAGRLTLHTVQIAPGPLMREIAAILGRPVPDNVAMRRESVVPFRMVDGRVYHQAIELAFPDVQWQGWEPVAEDGRLNPPLRPIQITHAGDGGNRLFVIDQSGMIHVFGNDPQATQARLFADLRDRVHPFRIDDEEGLLGFAFHPDYAANGEFYIYYSPESEPRGVRLSRMRVSDDDPDRADPDSEEVLLNLQQPFANHNGGPMAFGPDGCLYIGLGDGGGRNDPLGLGQDLSSLMGCLLRIDVDRRDPGRRPASAHLLLYGAADPAGGHAADPARGRIRRGALARHAFLSAL